MATFLSGSSATQAAAAADIPVQLGMVLGESPVVATGPLGPGDNEYQVIQAYLLPALTLASGAAATTWTVRQVKGVNWPAASQGPANAVTIGAVVGTTTGLTAETPVNLLTGVLKVKDGDQIELLQHQNGAGTAVVAGTVTAIVVVD